MKELEEDDMLLENFHEDEIPEESQNDEKECITPHTWKYWTIGSIVTIVVIIGALGMVKTRTVNMTPYQNNPALAMQQRAYTPSNFAAGQNFVQFPPRGNTAAYVPPNCATGPNAAQYFQQGSAVAAINAPVIYRDAVMPHELRGVCSNCHQIRPGVPIVASAQMPHEYRGVCSNCHSVQ